MKQYFVLLVLLSYIVVEYHISTPFYNIFQVMFGGYEFVLNRLGHSESVSCVPTSKIIGP